MSRPARASARRSSGPWPHLATLPTCLASRQRPPDRWAAAAHRRRASGSRPARLVNPVSSWHHPTARRPQRGLLHTLSPVIAMPPSCISTALRRVCSSYGAHAPCVYSRRFMSVVSALNFQSFLYAWNSRSLRTRTGPSWGRPLPRSKPLVAHPPHSRIRHHQKSNA
jgi:hypothetical protein